MRVDVLYFGAIRERVDRTSKESHAVPDGATVGDLVDLLCGAHPALRGALQHVKVAVNESFARRDDVLADGDVVALIPPIAGGAGPYVRLTDQPLSLDQAVAAVSGPEQGGIVTFVGLVRGREQGKDIVRLEYEAYGTMAEKSIAGIIRDCETAAAGVRVAVAHRTGPLVPGETAVIVAASARHRAEAFDAARTCIERIKAEVPIWKKEVSSDGQEWIEPVEGLSGPGLDWAGSQPDAARRQGLEY